MLFNFCAFQDSKLLMSFNRLRLGEPSLTMSALIAFIPFTGLSAGNLYDARSGSGPEFYATLGFTKPAKLSLRLLKPFSLRV